MTPEIFVQLLRWACLLSLVTALVAAPASRAQQPVRRPTPLTPRPPQPGQTTTQTPDASAPTRNTEPPPMTPVDKRDIHTNARTVVMSFDKRDLTEVIQFVSQFTQRNFILPERVSGKITILSNSPIPADDVWNVFVAALDANNWAVYPVGKYWKRWPDPRFIVVVLNNGDLNMVSWELRALGGSPKLPQTQDVPPFDYAGYAELLGFEGVRIARSTDVRPALERAFAARRPVLIDVHADPDVVALPPHATFEQTKKLFEALAKGDPDRGPVLRQLLKQLRV